MYFYIDIIYKIYKIYITKQLDSILAIDPQEWTQAQVIKWLQGTHDGDLQDLVEPFKAQKISGVTFVKLTEEILKNDLDIKQFGLRDGFISARNKLLERRNKNNSSQQTAQTSKQSSVTNSQKQDRTSAAIKQPSASKSHLSQRGENTTKEFKKQRSDKSEISRYSNNNDLTNIEKSKSNPNNISNPNPKQEESMTAPQQQQQQINNGYNQHKQSTTSAVSHQTTLSNNHLITKPQNAIRHNQSFDDTATNNNANQGAGGYEEIPDSFSPTAPSASNQMMNNHHNGGNLGRQINGGFTGMPNSPFQVNNHPVLYKKQRLKLCQIGHIFSKLFAFSHKNNIYFSMCNTYIIYHSLMDHKKRKINMPE